MRGDVMDAVDELRGLGKVRVRCPLPYGGLGADAAVSQAVGLYCDLVAEQDQGLGLLCADVLESCVPAELKGMRVREVRFADVPDDVRARILVKHALDWFVDSGKLPATKP